MSNRRKKIEKKINSFEDISLLEFVKSSRIAEMRVTLEVRHKDCSGFNVIACDWFLPIGNVDSDTMSDMTNCLEPELFLERATEEIMRGFREG